LCRYLIYLGFGIGSIFGSRVEAWIERRKGKRRDENEASENTQKETIIHVLKPAVEDTQTPKLALSGEWWCRDM
jgi:hypothetical protein